MPLYEYHCLPCDAVFEELCSLGEAHTKKTVSGLWEKGAPDRLLLLPLPWRARRTL